MRPHWSPGRGRRVLFWVSMCQPRASCVGSFSQLGLTFLGIPQQVGTVGMRYGQLLSNIFYFPARQQLSSFFTKFASNCVYFSFGQGDSGLSDPGGFLSFSSGHQRGKTASIDCHESACYFPYVRCEGLLGATFQFCTGGGLVIRLQSYSSSKTKKDDWRMALAFILNTLQCMIWIDLVLYLCS